MGNTYWFFNLDMPTDTWFFREDRFAIGQTDDNKVRALEELRAIVKTESKIRPHPIVSLLLPGVRVDA